jgi:serine/threonine-protein kinase
MVAAPGCEVDNQRAPRAYNRGVGETITSTTCDSILEEVAHLLDGSHALAPGTLVADRFEIIERIGVGGMGVVYRARDADLGRDVAIKLRRDEAPGGHARLLGEAQALARLAHPNVVPAYEVGKHEGAIYLAMELVEGVTLRGWLEERRRTWREAVALFRQAGAGLVAIHRVGLVYRDFKPDNVLVGVDGRVRVADLGLARPLGQHPDGASSGFSGTPVYMAPELWQGRAADARSDQYAFCVALHEAFFGVLPDDHTSGRRGDVPRRIRAAVKRGMADDPAARHPSMEALLRELAWDPAVRRRRLALVAIMAGLAGGAAWGAFRPRADAAGACATEDAKIREGWSAAARAEAKAAFLASGRPHAAGTWSRVETSLDDYARRYAAARREACEAPSSVSELQVACLDWRAAGMVELVRQFRRADADVVDRAVDAVASLQTLDRCANAATLLGAPPLPADDATLARVEAGLARLEAVAALSGVGRYVEGLEAGRALVEEARRLGYAPLLARALVATADHAVRSDPVAAEALLREAFPVAARAGDDETAARAANLLIWAVGVEQTKHAEAIGMIPAAEALAARAGGLAPADLDRTLGELAHMRGRHAEALEAHQRSLRKYEQARSPRARVHAAWSNVGIALLNLRRHDEAEAALRRALRLCEQRVGSAHPDCARVLLTMGDLAYDRRDLDAAAIAYQRSHDVYAAALGGDNLLAAIPLRQLARLEIHRGRAERALEVLDQVLPVSEASLGPDHPTTAEARFFQAVAHYELGRIELAEPIFARAAAAIEKALGPEHPRLVMYLMALANVAERREDAGAIRSAAERALAITRKVHGEDAPDSAAPLALLGAAARIEGRRRDSLAYLRQALDLHIAAHGDQHLKTAKARVDLADSMIRFGQHAGAIELLERALPVVDRSERRADHGEVRLLLARAHWGRGQRRRARELALAARGECESSCMASTRTEIAAWLREHGAR